MIQDQLVEYVSSQIKLGVSRDAIKSALTGVGWAEADVEDTLKKVESGAGQSSAPAQPVSSAQVAAKPSPLASFSPLDIVSDVKSAPAQTVAAAAQAQDSVKGFFGKKAAPAGGDKIESMKMPSGAKEFPPKTNGWKIADIIEAVIIIGLAALSAFLYFQNGSLSSKAGGQSSSTASQVAALTAQVQTLTASNAGMENQVASLMASNDVLQTNLAFLAIPLTGTEGSSSPEAATATATISGMLQSGAKSSYAITTAYGVKVSVKNASDPLVRSALNPLVGQTVQLTGTYLQGSAAITVTAVNGSLLTQAPPAGQSVTSTSSSTSISSTQKIVPITSTTTR